MTSPGHKIKVTRIHKLSTSHELLTTSNKSIQEQPKNQNLNNKDMENDPSINLRSRRYSSVHIQRINRPSANKSNASLPSNDLTQTTYLPFDLQITHSSLSKKKNLIQCSIKSDQRNPLPNYFDKIISPTEYVKARSQSLSEEKRFPSSVRVQRIIRTPTYVKQIHIPFNDHYRSQISAPDEIRSAPNKLNDLFYIPQHDLSTSISSTRTILPRDEDVIIRDEEPRLFTFYWILGLRRQVQLAQQHLQQQQLQQARRLQRHPRQQHRQAQVRPPQQPQAQAPQQPQAQAPQQPQAQAPQQPQAQAPQQAQRRLHRRQQAQRLQPYIFAIQKLRLQQLLVLVSHLTISNYMFTILLIILGNDLHWNKTGSTIVDQFKQAAALYIDANDTLYIADSGENHIQEWSHCENATTIAGSNSGTSGSTSNLFDSPGDVTFDKYGNMYVADHNNHRVQRFAPNSNVGTSVAGTGNKSGALTDLDHLAAIDVDDSLNIYIADIHNNRIIKWAANATNGTVLVSDTLIDKSYDILLSPTSTNQAYTSNTDKDNVYLWTFGNNNPTATLNQVNDSTSTLKTPKGMTLDPYGNLYVVDSENNRIVMYCANSTVGIVVVGGSSTTPALNKPTAVALDSNLNLYVAINKGTDIAEFIRL
ncbi:unnamed protein product [Rotaria socialis]|uniref:NHL repeat-containing protein n=1 Tax=Rotaria socialis TaxID=392032 RepID=A0A818Y3E5_9BILA|nr:unnamed protein product [Rotaria socialis]